MKWPQKALQIPHDKPRQMLKQHRRIGKRARHREAGSKLPPHSSRWEGKEAVSHLRANDKVAELNLQRLDTSYRI